MAREPSAVLPPLRFEPCPDRSACRQLVLDWEENSEGARLVMEFTGTGYHDGERGYFVFRRPDPIVSRDPWTWWTVTATDAGAIVSVIRHVFPEDGRGCYLGIVVVGEGRYLIEVKPGDDFTSILLGGELAAPADTLQRIVHLDPSLYGGGFINYLSVGREHIAAETTQHRPLRLGWDGAVQLIDGGMSADSPDVVGASILFDSFGTTDQILVSDAGARFLELVPPPGPGAEPVTHHRTDGATLAWAVGFNRMSADDPFVFDRVELWAAPFASTATELRPARVGALRNTRAPGYIMGGRGHAAVIDDDPAVIRFFRIADGHETPLRAPPGLQWTSFVSFIGPREVLAGAGRGAAVFGESAVQLIDYTALEPPL